MSGAGDRESAPSKSELKRESLRLQKLGEQLIALPEARLLAIPMPETLREAVREARSMKSRRALYRQRQFIGRLMRETDASDVEAALQQLAADQKTSARRFHHLEQWRDRLIEEGEELIGELLVAFPEADRQHVRQLIRQARVERDNDRPPAHARSLFRYLREQRPAATQKDADEQGPW